MGGKGGGSVNVPSMPNIGNLLNYANIQPSPYEQQMAKIANEYYQQTSPLRGYFLEDWGNFLRPASTQNSVTNTSTPSTATAGTPFTYSNPNATEIANQLGLIGTGSQGAGTAKEWFNKQGVDLSRYYPGINEGNYNAFNLINGNPDFSQMAQNIERDMEIKNLEAADKARSTNTGQITNTMGVGGGGGSNLTSQGLYNPYNLPGYAPLYQLARTGLESQYNPARENIMASTPRGGALYNNLANLEMSRAQQAGSLPATIATPLIQDIMNKAYGVAFNAPQVSLGGLSGAESGYRSGSNAALGAASGVTNTYLGAQQQAAMMNAAMNQQSSMALGQGLGQLAGLGIKAAMK